MDLEYMGRIMLSFAIFAPGLILLAFLSFLGLVMLAEKANLFRRSRRVSEEARELVAGKGASNPAPGRIAAALTEELEAAAAKDGEALQADADNVQPLRKGG